jgi:hypothetical protein
MSLPDLKMAAQTRRAAYGLCRNSAGRNGGKKLVEEKA